MAASVDSVSLFTAYYWDCPGCKHRNFSKGDKAPQDLVDEAIRDELELDEWQDVPEELDGFEAVMIPMEVKCSKCSCEFFCNDPNIKEESDE